MDKALAAQWISACEGYFAKDVDGTWKPSATATATRGWDISFRDQVQWDWNSLPVCDVYQDRSFDTVPVTVAAYDKRLQQLKVFFQQKLPADIYAFQEVSGEQAIRDALPNGGAGYSICSFTAFKVQRLAIAWKDELGTLVSCAPEPALSLPQNPADDQPRPGLALELNVDGKVLRVLAVHLKSSCVSPLEARGDLTSGGRDCTILQQQAVPLENWVEGKVAGADAIVMLGDFNRNFWHEQHLAGDVRTDGSDPKTALHSGVKVKHLFAEVFDGEPAGSALTLLPEVCPINTMTTDLCARGESALLSADERKQLSNSANLGCRNPLGLDHILIGGGLTASGPAQHIAVGVFGGTKPADASHPDPLLAISDHCPMLAKLTM